MFETPDDLIDLQRLLDVSYAAAGGHLQNVITPDRRLRVVAERATSGEELFGFVDSETDRRQRHQHERRGHKHAYG